MSDIAPELLEKIEKSFNEQFSKSDKLKAIRELINNKKATYEQANEYAVEVGEILASAFKTHLSSDVLPEGKMYYNIAEKILRPTLNNNYNIIAKVTQEIQAELNIQAGIGLKSLVTKVNKEKVGGIIKMVSNGEYFDDVSEKLLGVVVDFSLNTVVDVLKENCELQHKVGLKPTIVRKCAGNCCDWCSNLSGSYDYETVKNTGNDVFRRHSNCRCTVEYQPKGLKSRRQDVWSKEWK